MYKKGRSDAGRDWRASTKTHKKIWLPAPSSRKMMFRKSGACSEKEHRRMIRYLTRNSTYNTKETQVQIFWY